MKGLIKGSKGSQQQGSNWEQRSQTSIIKPAGIEKGQNRDIVGALKGPKGPFSQTGHKQDKRDIMWSAIRVRDWSEGERSDEK